MKLISYVLTTSCLSFITFAFADSTVPLYNTVEQSTGTNNSAEILNATKSDLGITITPPHHFITSIPDVHKPSCADKSMATGEHFDPNKTDKQSQSYDALMYNYPNYPSVTPCNIIHLSEFLKPVTAQPLF